MHKISILALDQMVLLDITIPYETFLRAVDQKGKNCYSVSLCGPKRFVSCSGVRLKVESSLVRLRKADTIIIPGMRDPEYVLLDEVRKELLRAHARGARLVTICSGTFLLAQTGLLNGKRATTHWLGADQLKEQYPSIDVDKNVLFVDSGQILTSAGGFAGMDLCLHILRKDFGAAVASSAAKIAVAPLERSGGQAQYISYELPQSSSSLNPVLNWMKANLQKDLSMEVVAERASMSVRTLNRQFQKQLGISPRKWVTLARVKCARELLETTDYSVERIAELSGFSSALSLREHFKDQVRLSPKNYRSSFRFKT